MGEFSVAFHSGDTVFYQNGQEIGRTGSHYALRKIPFAVFASIYREIGFAAVLILPMTAVRDAEEAAAAAIVRECVAQMQLKAEHIDCITDMILAGLQP